MLEKKLVSGLSIVCCSMAANAQSSVTIYGVIDVGFTNISNDSGHHVFKQQDGVNFGNRLGFKGTEDLGGGWSAVFDIENGFNLKDGSAAQGGALFGRQAWGGIASKTWGTLTAGRQYDFIQTFVQQYNYGGWASVYAGHQGDFDRISGQQLNDTVRYLTPTFAGFKAGAMYGFGEKTGSIRTHSSFSLGAGYEGGDLSLGASYLRMNDAAVYPYLQTGVFDFLGETVATRDASTQAVDDHYGFTSGGLVLDKQETAALGGSYKVGSVMLAANTTATRFSRDGTRTTQHVYEAGAIWFVGALQVIGAYQHDTLAGDRWNQFTGGLRYAMSKKTNFYASVSHLKASADVDATQGAGFYVNPSYTSAQTVSRVALLMEF